MAVVVERLRKDNGRVTNDNQSADKAHALTKYLKPSALVVREGLPDPSP
jgi:hypothetical protein